MLQTFEVYYTVRFKTVVTVEDGEMLEDAIEDIDIPENERSKYVGGTMEVENIFDDQQNAISIEAFDKNR